MVRPLPTRRPVGLRRDGRPIYPILGASSEDETNDQLDEATDSGQEQQVTVTQDRLGKMLTREKAQGDGPQLSGCCRRSVRLPEGADRVRHRAARGGAGRAVGGGASGTGGDCAGVVGCSS